MSYNLALGSIILLFPFLFIIHEDKIVELVKETFMKIFFVRVKCL